MTDYAAEDLPIFVAWMEFLKWLLPVTERFPRRARFTFADRMNNLALDIVEDLIEARYTSQHQWNARQERTKQVILKRANLRLEKLRVLLRLSDNQHYLSHQAYEHAIRTLNEIGRMLGAWIKQQDMNEPLRVP